MSDDNTPIDPTLPAGQPEFQRIDIVDEMKSSYLDYAMSVIVSRALPDVRDGLKPVHRRILWTSHENGFTAGKPYRKSARIVGDCMGKYHPHGDSAIYDALARMTQDWSMRLPLIDGQGNFGSMDPDPPASMRYTEARLAKVADALLGDIEKDTVDFQANYDGSENEPQVLPARFPNLLVNGAGGIAVGMATNIPPHNLGEVIDGCLAYMENPLISIDELIRIIPAPDFPTAPLILGTAGARKAYTEGRGSIIMRARHVIEETRGRGEGRRSIVLTSMPYQVGKSGLVEKIAEAAKDKRIEGVADIRDESNREGVRVVIDLKRDATPEVVLNQLWRNTPAQSNFPANMLAIRGGRPETLSLKDIIESFVRFREEVITRRTKFELMKARDRAHILLGLVIAVTNLDEVVRIIRGSANPAIAREALSTRDWPIAEIAAYIKLIEDDELADTLTYRLSETQVRAILDLRLHRLTALGRDEIGGELETLAKAIAEFLSILADRQKLYGVMRDELLAVRDAFATPRLSEITAPADGIEDEDLIEREDMVVTITLDGYIKRTPLSTFRAQNRGGKGRAGMATKDEDAVGTMFVASTHTPVLFFSTAGKVYRLKVWRLPEGGAVTRGRPVVNLLPALDQGETIAAVLALPEDEAEWGKLDVMFATAKGNVRRNAMDAFANIPSNGKYAMRFDEDATDRLIGVALLSEGDDVLLASRQGKAIRFAADDVREFQSRQSTGVRGMLLKDDDEVISLSVLHRTGLRDQDERDEYLRFAPWKAERFEREGEPTIDAERFAALAEAEQFILTVCANGYGKLSSAYEYRRTGRGGQGITNIDNIERNGLVVASFAAVQADQLMLVTDQAKLIRLPLSTLRVIGRGTAGVRLFNVADSEHVVSAVRLTDPDENGDDATGADTGGDSSDSDGVETAGE